MTIGCLCLCVHAATPSEEAAASATTEQKEIKGDLRLLPVGRGLNVSDMNVSLIASPGYSWAQAAKFTAPDSGWGLKYLIIAATDGWNASSNWTPKSLPFAIEIRDADQDILYRFSDTQLGYFTEESGPGKLTWIDIPEIPVEGDFYVCFYGYKSLGLATELQNATNSSYWYDRSSGVFYPGVVPIKDNKTIPVNWLIWVAGR